MKGIIAFLILTSILLLIIFAPYKIGLMVLSPKEYEANKNDKISIWLIGFLAIIFISVISVILIGSYFLIYDKL